MASKFCLSNSLVVYLPMLAPKSLSLIDGSLVVYAPARSGDLGPDYVPTRAGDLGAVYVPPRGGDLGAV